MDLVGQPGEVLPLAIKNGLADFKRQKDCDYRHNIILILRHDISISKYFAS